MRLVPQYELGPLLYFRSTVHGGLVKTAKSKLLALLEKDIPPVQNVPPSVAWMIDGMAVLQGITRPPSIFAYFATTVFNIATAPFRTDPCPIDFVVDRYPEMNIKPCKRDIRARDGVLIFKILPGYKNVLPNGRNI